jgi:class 3 adenylate cyclase
MPLYMDRHEVPEEFTPSDIAEAHVRDLQTQSKYGVDYITYWFDHGSGGGFCLVEGPSTEAVEAVHREAHGLVAAKIIEVDRAAVEGFLGAIDRPSSGEEFVATAFRAILFTDVVGSTELTQRLGDRGVMRVIHAHDAIVDDAIRSGGGRRVKHTGDGVMASFTSVSRSVEAAIAIQRATVLHNEGDGVSFDVRVAVSAASPLRRTMTSSELPFSLRPACARRARAVASWCRVPSGSCASGRDCRSRMRASSTSKASTSRCASSACPGVEPGEQPHIARTAHRPQRRDPAVEDTADVTTMDTCGCAIPDGLRPVARAPEVFRIGTFRTHHFGGTQPGRRQRYGFGIFTSG